MSATLIALDWGTSSFRAWLMDNNGEVMQDIPTGPGILAVENGGFEATFASLLSPWLVAWPDLPVIASGMITSRNGWIETPYLPLPIRAHDLADALHCHVTHDGRRVYFATGAVKKPDQGMPDVMRGEEVEIIGHLAAADNDDGLFVLPGTHSKWVQVRNGTITDFQTCMTGELFSILLNGSILGRLAETGQPSDDAFRRGVAVGLDGGALASRLFSARSLALMGHLEGREIGDYLSGLLIGDELAARLPFQDALVTIIGRGDLAVRYHSAIEQAGGQVVVAAPGMAKAGLWAIAKHAGIIC